MSIISNNIKYLRKKNKLTQEQFAGKINIKRSLVGAYEEGRADPRLHNLLNISAIFDVSVDMLISKDISTLHEQPTNSSQNPQDKSGLRVLAITVDQEGRELIELVPQKAAAGYLNGFADPEYLEELPKFRLPNLPANGTYRAFEISGDSMLPLFSGTVVVGQYVEDWQHVKSGKTYVVVTSTEGVVYKRVFNHIDEDRKLSLVSDNKIFAPFEVAASDVLEIWEAKAFISLQFPEPNAEQELTLQKLAGIVLNLQQEVIKLKER